MMNISLISYIDDFTWKIKHDVIPLAIRAIEGTHHLDYEAQEKILIRLRHREYIPYDQHIVLSLSYNPKTCGIPIDRCHADSNMDCKDCPYNPLTNLLNPYLAGGSCVLTDRYTIDTLLHVITLLAKASINNLLREIKTDDYENY